MQLTAAPRVLCRACASVRLPTTRHFNGDQVILAVCATVTMHACVQVDPSYVCVGRGVPSVGRSRLFVKPARYAKDMLAGCRRCHRFYCVECLVG